MIQVLSVKFYLHFDFVNFMLSIYYEIQASNKVPKFEHYNYWRSLVMSGTVFSGGADIRVGQMTGNHRHLYAASVAEPGDYW